MRSEGLQTTEYMLKHYADVDYEDVDYTEEIDMDEQDIDENFGEYEKDCMLANDKDYWLTFWWDCMTDEEQDECIEMIFTHLSEEEQTREFKKLAKLNVEQYKKSIRRSA